MPSFTEWRASLSERIPEISAADAASQARERPEVVLVDVRENDEHREGHLPQALHIPRGFLEMQAEKRLPDKDAPIVCYCAGGVRSLFAAETLRSLGYRDVRSLAGGYKAWKTAGLPTEKPFALSDAQRRRYLRHLSIPEVGLAGQGKLLQARVLMIGAGGLGCPAAIYLAAAGVGRLGIVDFDNVDESNLQRQILHTTDRVGTPKIASATLAIQALNPDVEVVPFEERLDSSNVERIFEGWDLVVDGSDNFPTRYLINDACVRFGLPCVHGSVYRFDGQVSVFAPGRGGPCYRCLYPEPPPPELAPSCADAGVLGVLPGVVGLLQAIETIKLIIGVGNPLIGRLLAYDALAASFNEFKLRRNASCGVCGDGVEFPGFVDYEQFCANPALSGP